MTEGQWQTSTDPNAMLRFLRGRASDRKLRLFACACCRQIPNLQWDEFWKDTYELAERFADGFVSAKRMRHASKALGREVALRAGEQHLVHLSTAGRWLLAGAPAYLEIASVIPGLSDVPIPQAALLRDVFGPLAFRAVAVGHACGTSTVFALGQAIYADRAFDRLPVLADALEETGCTEAEILDHLRSRGPHVRGCWAVDLLLNKG